MSGNVVIATPVRLAGVGFLRAGSAIRAYWQHAMRLRETRRYLEQMDDHMLHDIGVSRAQAFFELDSPHRPGKRG
jgi:uncharacterized protein YjiS (DUF1127 family)